MKLRVTDTTTGKVWEDDNVPHSWQDLCLFIMKRHKDFHIQYADIECIASSLTAAQNKDTGRFELIRTWYILDECGSYEPLPPEFTVVWVTKGLK